MDFYDLKNTLKKHWNEFTDALGDWKTMEVRLSELEKQFASEAAKQNLNGLKGDGSVGGIRASIYNAFPKEGV